MKKKQIPFPFILKIVLLSSLLLIGKLSREKNIELATAKHHTPKAQDSLAYKIYPTFILKNVAWKVKE